MTVSQEPHTRHYRVVTIIFANLHVWQQERNRHKLNNPNSKLWLQLAFFFGFPSSNIGRKLAYSYKVNIFAWKTDFKNQKNLS